MFLDYINSYFSLICCIYPWNYSISSLLQVSRTGGLVTMLSQWESACHTLWPTMCNNGKKTASDQPIKVHSIKADTKASYKWRMPVKFTQWCCYTKKCSELGSDHMGHKPYWPQPKTISATDHIGHKTYDEFITLIY